MFSWSPSKLSFNKQFSTVFAAGILILAMTSSLVISWVVSTSTRANFIEQGIQLTQQFATQSQLSLLFGAEENAELSVKTLLAFPDVRHVAIYNLDYSVLLNAGDTLEKTNELLMPFWLQKAGEAPHLAGESPQAWYFVSKVVRFPDPDLIDSPFVEIKHQAISLGYVVVKLGKDSLHGLMQRLFVNNILIALILASVLLFILRLITRRLTTPLERLSEIMSRADKGETGIRAALHGPKDILVMGQAFNKMMSVIEKRQTELRAARDAALETAKAKADFAAMVSHEIRTPLNGVLGMLNLLKKVGVPDKQQQYLDVAIQSGDALLDLINNILDFSKMDAGKMVLESIEFNLRTHLEDALILFSEKAQRKNIELCLDIPHDLPITVKGDLNRLCQVLSNLLSNAVKFTEEGHVLLSVILQKGEREHWRLQCSIQDTGVGIPLEAQRKIFEAFSQADSNTTRKFGGTGLGLTICRQLIDLLGGQLKVESVPGKGSDFSFSIPLEVIEEYQPDWIFEGKTCLIVDKNQHNRRYLVNTLSSFGCRCSTAEHERDVFRKDNRGKQQYLSYDLLLLNENACKLNVEQFMKRVRTRRNKLARRIVILVNPLLTKSTNAGIDATIGLPVRYQQLRQQLSCYGTDDNINTKPNSPPPRLTSDIQILVVDDNRTNQLVAKGMLNELGYLTDIASGGREAVEYAAKKPYDLVLMDCNMPDMDGFEATRRIRSHKGQAEKMPIFAMTASDNPKNIKRCSEVGMDDYLIKPLTLEVLIQKLNYQFQFRQAEEEALPEAHRCHSIDAERFANLENAVGNKVSEIIEAFLTDTPSYIIDIRNAIDHRQWSELSDLAHNLKGSSSNLGINLFASVCREIEDLSSNGTLNESQVEELFTDLQLEFRRSEEALRGKLAILVDSKRKRKSAKRETILIVDDDRSTRLTIANALELDGLYIEQAVNGREALNKFKKCKPNLVIMDAIMPVMDGFDASFEIKHSLDGAKTPILIITALENDESIERAFKSGAADFIPKPINLAVLRRRVKRILDALQSEQRAERLAYIDGLTGLPNRIAFSDRLMQDLAYARRNANQLAVMFFDIDHFKDVNDNLGHAAGDELLKVFAERVNRSVRSEDTLARLGGDEFVVVLSSISGPKGADTVAKNLLKSLATPFQIAGRELYVGASIGISIYPEDGADRETLLKNADTAMYRAKALGRNNYQFYAFEMSVSISDRVELETDLRKVLQKDEMIIYYQPKADAKTGNIVGAEALLRWQHPRRGFLLPDTFISIADEIGVLDEIGMSVLNTACSQFCKWLKLKQFEASIAVNVSARQLMNPGFVDNVKHSLEMTGLNPEYLELEITESTILEHVEETIKKLKLLEAMGISIAIDDFGVGYSSFSYLKRLPVNVLKIDRSFIRDVTKEASDAAVVDGMIKLAHNLNLKVVAEGVENAAQFDFLREHDCDIVQGNFIGKPVPPGTLLETTFSQNYKRH